MSASNEGLKLYEIHVPVGEIWVYEVEGKNPDDALRRLSAGEGQQTHTYAGGTKDNRTHVYLKRPKAVVEK
jgi:hypothetical protein